MSLAMIKADIKKILVKELFVEESEAAYQIKEKIIQYAKSLGLEDEDLDAECEKIENELKKLIEDL
jgi:D-ribose pyranose/furanose isomerase RbsD